MKIVNKGKFIKTNLILIIIVGAIIGFTTNTYSKVETKYKEEYVYSGDTLWSIAQNELENNKYFAVSLNYVFSYQIYYIDLCTYDITFEYIFVHAFARVKLNELHNR